MKILYLQLLFFFKNLKHNIYVFFVCSGLVAYKFYSFSFVQVWFNKKITNQSEVCGNEHDLVYSNESIESLKLKMYYNMGTKPWLQVFLKFGVRERVKIGLNKIGVYENREKLKMKNGCEKQQLIKKYINISHLLICIQLIKMEDNQVNDQVIKQLLYSKKYKELVDKATELGLVKQYSKMKYDGIIYSIGQIVQLSVDGNRDKKTYGKLVGFCNLQVDEYLIPMIKVQKYINKLELPQKLKELQDGLSEFELFQSEIEEWLFCTQIDHEIKLISIREYEEMTIQNERTYFTRADYNVEKDKFSPPISKWGRICICNQISNPDKSYVQCDKCQKWLHYECAGVQGQLAQDQNFYCLMCRKK